MEKKLSHLTRNNFVRLKNVALSVYASAERDYSVVIQELLCGSYQPHKWSTTHKLAYFGVDSSVPPLVKSDGCVIRSTIEQTTLFVDFLKVNRVMKNFIFLCPVFLSLN